MNKLREFFPVSITVIGTAFLLVLTQWLNPRGSNNLATYFTYQGLSLLVSAAVVAAVWFLRGRKLEFARIGDLHAPASPNQLLGIKTTDNWRNVGLTFAIAISVVTSFFLLANYANSFDGISPLAWVIAFLAAIPLSAVNALNEEVITRWSLVEGLGARNARYAPGLSAIIFGSVHYFGVPGGFIGCLMAAFLGWFLTKSIQDTRGIGWAWGIHFVQDVLIFTVTIASIV